MQQYFRVGLGDEPAPEASELLRQLDVVVDFPVDDDPQGAVAVTHRLVARLRQVEHRKAAHSEPDRTLQVQPRVIGSAVDQTVSHSLEQRSGTGAPSARKTPTMPHTARPRSGPYAHHFPRPASWGLKAAIRAPVGPPRPRRLKLPAPTRPPTRPGWISMLESSS